MSAKKQKNESSVWMRFFKLDKWFRGFLYILVPVLFFSYYPVISFGKSESMYFEASLPILWLILFNILILVMLIRRRKLFCDFKKWWIWLLLPMWILLSVIWSLNVVRGVLTVGMLWLIVFAVYGMWQNRELFDASFRERFLKWFFISTLIVCGWCILQCILDLVGVSRDYSLMCQGCTYQMFGFPHPNGFAVEPQFMGNLLLAPAIVAVWLFIFMKQGNKNLKHKKSEPAVVLTTGTDEESVLKYGAESACPVVKTTPRERKRFKFLLPCFLFIIATTLFLTFSRGAIYAFIVAMVFMSVMVIVMEKKQRAQVGKRVGVVWIVTLVAFVLALNIQGVMAQVSKTNDTYQTGVAKVLNHLSLGIVDLRGKNDEAVVDNAVEKPVENVVDNTVDNMVENDAVFDGYVAESTDVRMNLNKVALEAWRKDFKTAMIGVGIGGAGQALYNDGLMPSAREIVQNEYVSLLLETGLIGIIILILTLILLIRLVVRSREMAPMILAVMVGYGVSLMFFSGLPNALHIYLLTAVFLVMGMNYKVKRKKLVS